MQQQILHELLQALEQELLRLGYTKGSMAFYRNRWRKLEDFADPDLVDPGLPDWNTNTHLMSWLSSL